MGILIWPLWAMLGAAWLRRQLPRFDGQEQRYLQWGLILSLIFSVLHVWVVTHVLGGGDMLWYHRAGGELADLWQSDPGRWTPELLKLTLRMPAEFPFWVHGKGGGNATGAMFGVSAWLMILNGKSIYAACAFLALLNFFARVLIYRVLRPLLVPEHRPYILMGILLLPSTIFWTSGLEKESVAMVGMGIAVAGAYALAERGQWVRGVAMIALGGFSAYLIKPYVLFPFFIAAPVWYLAARMRADGGNIAILLTPMRMVIFGALLALGLMVLAYLVPNLSIDNLSDELASVQHAGTRVTGSTNYALVSAESAATRGRTAQLVAAPFAFLFALTRPWFFEARSGQTLVATVETTALTLLLLFSIRRIGWMRWFRSIVARPWLIFCLTYVVIFGTAVGLGSTNVGSLSRYRVPMMAFYGALVAVSYAWAYRPVRAEDALTSISTPPDGQGEAVSERAPLRIRRAPKGHALAVQRDGAMESPRMPAAQPLAVRRTHLQNTGIGAQGNRRAPLRIRRVHAMQTRRGKP